MPEAIEVLSKLSANSDDVVELALQRVWATVQRTSVYSLRIPRLATVHTTPPTNISNPERPKRRTKKNLLPPNPRLTRTFRDGSLSFFFFLFSMQFVKLAQEKRSSLKYTETTRASGSHQSRYCTIVYCEKLK